jgi:hypothetical protein
MTTVFLASFESSRFSFRAVGDSREAAIKALHKGLRKHGKQYGISANWWMDDKDEINVTEMRLNVDTVRDSGTVI